MRLSDGSKGLGKKVPPSERTKSIPEAADETRTPLAAVLNSATVVDIADVAPEPKPAFFNEAVYLATNPDVARAVADGSIPDARSHWLQHGESETARGQRPSIVNLPHFPATRSDAEHLASDDVSALERGAAAAFDAEGYAYLHADLRRVIGPDPAATEHHWRHHGQGEGRSRPGVSPFADRVAEPADVLARPFGVNVFGPLTAASGLGTAARGVARCLSEAGIPFEAWNYDMSAGYVRVAEIDRTRPPRYRINLLLANADTIAGLYRAFPRQFFNAAYNIGLWQWELASFRPDWFTAFGAVDEVWTNSEFQRAAIAASAPVPVRNIHLPIEEVLPHELGWRRPFGIPEDKFSFLCVFDIGSTSARKNPFAAIRAMAAAFGERTDVVLVLKFHSNQHEPNFIAALNQEIRALDNVVVLAGVMSEPEMVHLRRACDCLVSPHRSEGFGLNIAEFMALGKPVIATRYSGNTDFFDETVGYPVDFDLVEITQSTGPYSAGYVWAEPDVASLAHQMRAVADGREEAARRGAVAAERIRTGFSHAAIAQRMRARFRELSLDAGPIPFLGWVGKSGRRAVFNTVVAGTQRDVAPMQGLRFLPMFSVVVPVYNVPGAWLERCIQSVLGQSYSFWELCLCNDRSTRADTIEVLERYRGVSPKIKIRDLPQNRGIAGASNAAAEMATGDFIVLLDNDDELTPDALWETASALSRDPEIDCLYSDEDKVDEAGERIDHFFKPDWSPEHLESVMYVLHMLVIRKSLFFRLGGFRPAFDGAQDYDLMLRCSRATQRIHHIPRVLYHWRAIAGSSAYQVDAKPGALVSGHRALLDHAVRKYGAAATVEEGLTAGTFRLRRPLRGQPKATLLILTNNAAADLPGRGSVRLVDNLVASILERTDYPDYEIVVVENSCLTDKQKATFRMRSVRVENFDHGSAGFNYAAKANYAASCARTEHVVFLNDDMEVIRPDWLTALLELSQDLEIGGVGARLLHFDGTVQHVGMVLGVNGSAAHVYHSFPGEAVGYNAFTHIVRNYSVVTAACFATRSSVLAQVGGFDEKFAIDFNDIDLCLRIRQAGYRIAYTPYAQLYHFEQASAPRTVQATAEVDLFVDRWSGVIANDPYYNPNLARDRVDYFADPGPAPAPEPAPSPAFAPLPATALAPAL